ncbi:Prolyl tripeptidyl peptidase precursor [Planctomycetes bacterium Poly30]|uniref:Prolyl tripeptidyl peptidase n=2 Tax=Saltatorellus ferox TaxID=2528018 RepID=A0A518EXX2_9BACT|nr:Prolyl tripeptidyl peptidase precursor [Planctomycetes bacterium Poly30]
MHFGSACLAAQGSEAQYQRAASLGERLRGAVRGADLGYRWSEDGSRLWFERPGEDGKPAAFEIVVKTGERVASTSLDEIEADSPWALRLEPTRAWARTRRNGARVQLRFVNRTEGALELEWLDGSGSAKSYGTVAAGESRVQDTVAGHLWRVSTEGGESEALGMIEAPAGGGAVFVDGPAGRGEERRRPRRGESGPDAEELDIQVPEGERRVGRPSMAPDGKHVAYLFETAGEHREVTLVEAAPSDQLQPRAQTFRYDKPGDALDVRMPRAFSVESGEEVELDRGQFPDPWSIRDLHWSEDGTRLYFVHVQRGHRVVKLIELDVRSGVTRAVIDERPETFFDYANKLYVRHLEATDEVLWMSERSGWNHLYRVNRSTGEVASLTTGLGEETVVRAVESVDEEARTVRLRLRGLYPDQDPYHDHFARIDIDTGAATPLTFADGTHSLEFSPDGAAYVATWQRVDHAPVRELRRSSDGGLIAELSRADASAASNVLARLPARFVAPGRDGKTPIHGILHWPSDFDPSRRYPVIEEIYAGPHDAHVPKTFRLNREPQRLAELGFIVVQIDGMGTNWRSKAFHDVAWKNLADAGFPDRIAWMKAAAQQYPEMDLTRVGIYGGSAGGQNAMRAVLDHATFYRAAAADCGCHDNRMDKVWWNELWMGWPVDDSYLASSNLEHASRLAGALLLTVGAMDRNVDPSSTMQVVQALIEADKDFDLIVFPSGGHGAGSSKYGRRRRDDFFIRNLYGHEPRLESPPASHPLPQTNAPR